MKQTHCKREHELTAETTYVWRGNRRCRACANVRAKDAWEAKKELARRQDAGDLLTELMEMIKAEQQKQDR